MDERMKELVAIGASAAVNCHPCLRFHLAKCDELGIDRAAAREAIEVGLMVNRGAAGKTRGYIPELLGDGLPGDEERQDDSAPSGCGCG